jgi:SAM-dependent methyltransferase
MTMKVLQSERQIADARREMVDRDISAIDPSLTGKAKAFLKRFGIGDLLVVGDFVKSWDVLATVKFLEERVGKDAPIMDMGSYASEVMVALHKAGFQNLTGVDLNPRLRSMPYADSIHYEVSDFMDTPFQDGTFEAITSISVIEHGFDQLRLLKETARLLKPGGFFIASFDYWPEKIDTTGTRFFDMDWLIFSRDEIRALVEEATRHGLHPVGDLQFDGGDKAIRHGGFQYTFGWLVLQKRA